jgi:hypothetical protein
MSCGTDVGGLTGREDRRGNVEVVFDNGVRQFVPKSWIVGDQWSHVGMKRVRSHYITDRDRKSDDVDMAILTSKKNRDEDGVRQFVPLDWINPTRTISKDVDDSSLDESIDCSEVDGALIEEIPTIDRVPPERRLSDSSPHVLELIE